MAEEVADLIADKSIVTLLVYAFLALIGVVFLVLVVAFFGRVFFALLFLVVGVVLTLGLKTAFPKSRPAWLFAVFVAVLVFALAVIML